ncbi:MAG: hypothetical protein V2B20_18690 [Pseudomonadota bacterium]
MTLPCIIVPDVYMSAESKGVAQIDAATRPAISTVVNPWSIL